MKSLYCILFVDAYVIRDKDNESLLMYRLNNLKVLALEVIFTLEACSALIYFKLIIIYNLLHSESRGNMLTFYVELLRLSDMMIFYLLAVKLRN